MITADIPLNTLSALKLRPGDEVLGRVEGDRLIFHRKEARKNLNTKKRMTGEEFIKKW